MKMNEENVVEVIEKVNRSVVNIVTRLLFTGARESREDA